MFNRSAKQRLTLLEIEFDELRDALLKQNQALCETAKESLKFVEAAMKSKAKLEDDVEALKAKLELTIRAQCATYSAALERVQTMLEFEKRKNG